MQCLWKLEEKAKEEQASKVHDANNKSPSKPGNPQGKKKGPKRGREPKEKVGPTPKSKEPAAFEASSLFGPEVKTPVKRYTPSSARASSEPRKRGGGGVPGRAHLRRQTSSSALSNNSTDSTDLRDVV